MKRSKSTNFCSLGADEPKGSHWNGHVWMISRSSESEESLDQLLKNHPQMGKEERQNFLELSKGLNFKVENYAILVLDRSGADSQAIWILPAIHSPNFKMFEVLKAARSLWQKLHERGRDKVIFDLRIWKKSQDLNTCRQVIDALVSAQIVGPWKPQSYGKAAGKKSGDSDKHWSSHFLLNSSMASQEDLTKQMHLSQSTAEATNLVRNLTIRPGNKLDCKEYVHLIKKCVEETAHLSFKFHDVNGLKKLNAGAFLAVAQGSAHRDAGIAVITYKPPHKSTKKKKRIHFVGKGIVYDTGGVCLKPASSMFGMHGDMMGSAIALSLVLLAAREEWSCDVRAYLAISDNAISDRAFRPNDVVIASNGLSIETVHTDAEGRMVLADTLVMASEDQPSLIMDFATLTGSAVRAIGTNYSAVFSNREELYPSLISAGKDSGERVWPFPLDHDYGDVLKSDIADTKQCRLSGGPDHIEAAFFLRRFVNPDCPWVHVDLAASENDGGLAHVPSKETGFGVRFAVQAVKNLLTQDDSFFLTRG